MTPKNSETGRSYELEPRGEDGMPARAATATTPSLERLAEGLEDGTWELGKLVEQEHAPVPECCSYVKAGLALRVLKTTRTSVRLRQRMASRRLFRSVCLRSR